MPLGIQGHLRITVVNSREDNEADGPIQTYPKGTSLRAQYSVTAI